MFNDFPYSQPAYSLGLGTTTSNNPFGDPTGFSAADRYPDITPNPQPQSQPWQPQQQSSNRGGSASLHPDVFPGGGNWTPGPPNPAGWQPSMPQIPHNTHFYQLMQAHAQARVAPAGAQASYSHSPSSSFPPSQGYGQYAQYDAPDNNGYASNPNVAQFDPVINQTPQSQSWGQPSAPQSNYGPVVQNMSYQLPSQHTADNRHLTSSTNSHPLHPREYVQKNRALLENWDQYHWKQALNAFDSLEEAWRSRLEQLQMEQNKQRLQFGLSDPNFDQLIRAAQSNRDATASCKLQMKEVKSGYQLSNNLASRQMVREALNAGLKDLPGWP